MAPLRDGIPSPGRYFDPAGFVGPLDGFIRLRYLCSAGLAYHDLSSILCSWGDLRRVRNGVDADAPCAVPLQARRCIHLGSYRRDVQTAPADRVDRRIRLYDGVLRCVLWGKSVRAVCLSQSLFWSLLVGFLDDVYLQCDHAAAHVGSRV